MVVKLKLVILFIIASTFNLVGQKGWEMGPNLGISNYFGDLNTSFDLSEIGPVLGGIARYNLNNRLATKFGLNYSFVYGDDADSPNLFEQRRNLSFRADIVDLSLSMEFNFLPFIHGNKDYFFTPYLLGGLNTYLHIPSTTLDGQRYNLRPLGTEGQLEGEEYSLINLGLVVGAGMKWDLNEDWSFNVEWSARRLFTDYVDDVSKTFPNNNSLRVRRGEIAAALSDRSVGEKIGEPGRQRGNSRDNDTISFLTVGLVYYFGDLECPTISRK